MNFIGRPPHRGTGRMGSPMRYGNKYGYRLDPPHPGRPAGDPKSGWHINWMHFDVVDKMKTVDFIKYFEYIWYPSSDDIDVIDENLNWIMLIDHEGGVRLLNP
jgi:hypothetical protein